LWQTVIKNTKGLLRKLLTNAISSQHSPFHSLVFGEGIDNKTEYYWWEDFRAIWKEAAFSDWYSMLVIAPLRPPFPIP